jgi:hypothetical protein
MHQLPTEVLVEDLVGMQKPYPVMRALFGRIPAEVKEEKAKVGTSSNVLSPGPWTPNVLDQVDPLEEANLMMGSPTKLNTFPAKWADAALTVAPKVESSDKIPVDGTGKANCNQSTVGLIPSGWNNCVNNVAKLENKTDSLNGGNGNSKRLCLIPCLKD